MDFFAQKSARAFWLALALGLAYVAALAPTLALNHLLDGGELTAARPAMAAAREGGWWPLRSGGRPLLDRPPAMVWAGALAAKSGWGLERSLRLIPCLAAGLALGLAVWLAARATGRLWAGALAGVALALSPTFILHARHFGPESASLAAALAALALLWSALQREHAGRSAGPRWALAGGCLALAAALEGAGLLPLLLALALGLRACGLAGRGLWARVLGPALAVEAAWLALAALTGGLGGLAHALLPRHSAALAETASWLVSMQPLTLACGLPLLASLALQRDAAPRPHGGRLLRGTLKWALVLALAAAPALGLEPRAAWYRIEALTALGLALRLASAADPLEAWALALALALAAALPYIPGPAPLAATAALAVSFGAAFWLVVRPGKGECRPGAGRALAAAALALALLAPQAWRYARRPPAPKAALLQALAEHPARRFHEPLLVVGEPTQAIELYTWYLPTFVDAPPLARPDSAMVMDISGGRTAFLPARDAGRPAEAR